MLGTYSKDLSSVHSAETSLSDHISFALSTSSSSSSSTLRTLHRTNGTTSKQTNNNINGSSKEDSFEPLTPQKTARALLLFNDKESEKPAGYAVYYFTFSTWSGGPGIYLEDLFVKDEFRGRGFGVALLRKLAHLVCSFRSFVCFLCFSREMKVMMVIVRLRLTWWVLEGRGTGWQEVAVELFEVESS
jgi:GNAT superfamily N-acetyltransferase